MSAEIVPMADVVSLAERVARETMLAGHAAHPDDGWRGMPPSAHLLHAGKHLLMHDAGDTSEPHLRHALTRIAMALTLQESEVAR